VKDAALFRRKCCGGNDNAVESQQS
jgi:hypothetical protein